MFIFSVAVGEMLKHLVERAASSQMAESQAPNKHLSNLKVNNKYILGDR